MTLMWIIPAGGTWLEVLLLLVVASSAGQSDESQHLKSTVWVSVVSSITSKGIILLTGGSNRLVASSVRPGFELSPKSNMIIRLKRRRTGDIVSSLN